MLVEETFQESLYIVTLGVVREMFLEFLIELTGNYPVTKETPCFLYTFFGNNIMKNIQCTWCLVLLFPL